MKNEFIEILNEFAPGHTAPTEKEYHDIEIVYIYHPLIGNKEKIVRLWAEYGNMIIKDMLPRSEQIRDAEQAVDEARYKVEEAKRVLQERRDYLDKLWKNF